MSTAAMTQTPHPRTHPVQEDAMTTLTQPTPTRPATDPTPERTRGTAYPPPLEEVRPVSLGRLVSVELRKLVDTRTGKGLILAIVLITVAALGVTLWLTRDTGAALLPLLMAAVAPQALLLPVLGVITAANEWSQRTALITFAQEPRRMRVMAAKTVAAVLLGLAVLAVTVPLAMGAHVLSASLADAPVELTMSAAEVVNLTVAQVQGVLMGIGLGALFLNVPLGIVAYFLIPTITPLLFSLTGWLRDVAPWLDLSRATAPLMGNQWLTGEQWAQVATSNALWVLLPLVLGLVRIARKEVK